MLLRLIPGSAVVVTTKVDHTQKNITTNPRMESSQRQTHRRDEPTVFVIDYDDDVRQLLDLLFSGAGFSVSHSTCAAEALEHCDPTVPGCYVLDIHLPDMDGLQLQEQLVSRGCRQPFIFLSSHADVAEAVEALQRGAVDFLEKPFDSKRLLRSAEEAILANALWREVEDAIQSLTDRERELLPMIAVGKLSKEIAKFLDISPRTVEVHRRNIMHKMGADTVAQLVRMVMGHSSGQDD